MMNKLLVFFSLFLIVSMGFVTIPNIIHADSQLDILVKITQNTKEHLKNDIDKLDNISQKVFDFYDSLSFKPFNSPPHRSTWLKEFLT